MTNSVWKKVGLALATAIALTQVASAAGVEYGLGKYEYEANCQVCHGSTGQGDGEFSQYLNVKPADLTVLTVNNDGVFPFLDVFQTVDGRAVVRGHGDPMPVWGNTFTEQIGESAGPYGSELLIRARIVSLVDYVQSLQR